MNFIFPYKNLITPPPHKINEWDETVDLTGPIDHLPVSDLILKLYGFDIFLFELFSFRDKMVLVPCKSNGKDKEFEYSFLKFSRYLNLV